MSGGTEGMKAEEIAKRVAELRALHKEAIDGSAIQPSPLLADVAEMVPWALDTIEALLMNLEEWDEVYAGANRHRSQLLSIRRGHESRIRRLTDERDGAVELLRRFLAKEMVVTFQRQSRRHRRLRTLADRYRSLKSRYMAEAMLYLGVNEQLQDKIAVQESLIRTLTASLDWEVECKKAALERADQQAPDQVELRSLLEERGSKIIELEDTINKLVGEYNNFIPVQSQPKKESRGRKKKV